MQILGIWQWLEEQSVKFRDWIAQHYNNPLLWVGILVIGFLVFRSVYGALNKD
jgi:cytochrome b